MRKSDGEKIEGSMDVGGLKAARQTKSVQFSSTLRVSPGFPRQQLGVMPGDVSFGAKAAYSDENRHSTRQVNCLEGSFS